MITARGRFWLRLLMSAVLIGFLLWRVNWAGLALALSRIQMGTALRASLLTLPLILLLALRWRIFLRQQSISIPSRTVLGLTWAGQFFNSVLPGSTGGDVVKIYQLCRMFPDRKAVAAVTVIIDRLSALLVLAGLAIFALFSGPTLELSRAGLSFGVSWRWLVLALVGVGLLVATGWRLARRSPHWMARLRYFLSVLRTSFNLNANMVMALVLAGFIHLLNFAIFWMFARALGIDLTYSQVLSFMPVVFALLMVPVTVNGHGLREVLLFFYFTHMHVALGGAGIGPAEIVVSLSLVGVSNDLLWAVPGGIWYMLQFKATARDVN